MPGLSLILYFYPATASRFSVNNNSALVWLRSVALAVNESGELDRALTATSLFSIAAFNHHGDALPDTDAHGT